MVWGFSFSVQILKLLETRRLEARGRGLPMIVCSVPLDIAPSFDFSDLFGLPHRSQLRELCYVVGAWAIFGEVQSSLMRWAKHEPQNSLLWYFGWFPVYGTWLVVKVWGLGGMSGLGEPSPQGAPVDLPPVRFPLCSGYRPGAELSSCVSL